MGDKVEKEPKEGGKGRGRKENREALEKLATMLCINRSRRVRG